MDANNSQQLSKQLKEEQMEQEDENGGLRQTDKLEILIKKWQEETREEIKKKGEKDFDFLSNAPEGLMERVKDYTRSFVEEQWAQ